MDSSKLLKKKSFTKARVHKMEMFYHYSGMGKMKLDQSMIYDQINPWFKPRGLWITPENSNDDQTWSSWCQSENFEIDRLKYRYEIELNDSPNILMLKSPEEIADFSHSWMKAAYRISDYFAIPWNEVKEKYDGLIITPYQWSMRHNMDAPWYYSWDCASGCIWNLDAIKSFKKDKNYKFKPLDTS